MKKNRLSEEIISSIYKGDFNMLTDCLTEENINYTDKDGRSPIFYAIIEGQIALVKLFLSKSARLDIKDKMGWYPLHYAAQNYQVEMAELLIENNSNVEAKDNYGNTALFRAVFESQGRGDMIACLLSNGANYNNANNYGISPLEKL